MKTVSKIEAALKAVQVAHAIAEVIRNLGEVPSGHLYARVMGVMDLSQYEQVIDLLIDARLVERDRSHLLRWAGPAANPQPNQAS
jgi:hypothetical protein